MTKINRTHRWQVLQKWYVKAYSTRKGASLPLGTVLGMMYGHYATVFIKNKIM
jgi:hypothetical protein